MSKFEGVQSSHFNKYVKKHTDENNYPPEDYKIALKLPMDIAVQVLTRFEKDNLFWPKGKQVKLNELAAHLLWCWANGYEIDLKSNVFEPFFPHLVKTKKNQIAKLKNPYDRRGRPRKIQTNLLNDKLEQTNTGET